MPTFSSAVSFLVDRAAKAIGETDRDVCLIVKKIIESTLRYDEEVRRVQRRGPNILPDNHVDVMLKAAEQGLKKFDEFVTDSSDPWENFLRLLKNISPTLLDKAQDGGIYLEDVGALLEACVDTAQKDKNVEMSADDEVLEVLQRAGGKLWEAGDKRRVYFNHLQDYYGLKVEYYNTGNVSHAELDGEVISNSSARRILGILAFSKLWYDLVKDSWGLRGLPDKMAKKIINEGIRERSELSEAEWKKLGLWFDM